MFLPKNASYVHSMPSLPGNSLLAKLKFRMGASDRIESGQSTFFVELQQTSLSLKYATPRSLVILDEVILLKIISHLKLGRGTSTVDGCSLAHATLSYIMKEIKCFILFVTHYWLLTQIEEEFPGALTNYHMSYYQDEEEKLEGKITFLYRLTKGAASGSYGLNVAALAGIPKSVINRAAEISKQVEDNNRLFQYWSTLIVQASAVEEKGAE